MSWIISRGLIGRLSIVAGFCLGNDHGRSVQGQNRRKRYLKRVKNRRLKKADAADGLIRQCRILRSILIFCTIYT